MPLIIDNISGMQNNVVTLYELTQGEDVVGEEFSGMHQDVLVRVLKVLESGRKCEVILEDDIQGVKFFWKTPCEHNYSFIGPADAEGHLILIYIKT